MSTAGSGVARQLRFGFIGCGEIAVETAAGIAASSHARLAGAMDVNADLARDLGDRYGVPWTTEVDDLLARDDVDAVYIAVPHDLHADMALRAARAGKHVYCEKPIATTLADADAMIEACRAAGVALGVAFVAQTSPSLQAARELVRSGAIGRITAIRYVELHDKPASYWSSGWTGRAVTTWRMSKARAGGGVMIMNAIHGINAIRYVTGLEATRVTAEMGTTTDTPGIEVEDYAVATIRYDSGAMGHIQVGAFVPGPYERNGATVYGTTGRLFVDMGWQAHAWGVAGLEADADGWARVGDARSDEERRLMADGFAGAVLAGETVPVTGEDGREALRLVLAVYEAAEQHRAMTLVQPGGAGTSRSA